MIYTDVFSVILKLRSLHVLCFSTKLNQTYSKAIFSCIIFLGLSTVCDALLRFMPAYLSFDCPLSRKLTYV